MLDTITIRSLSRTSGGGQVVVVDLVDSVLAVDGITIAYPLDSEGAEWAVVTAPPGVRLWNEQELALSVFALLEAHDCAAGDVFASETRPHWYPFDAYVDETGNLRPGPARRAEELAHA